MSSPDWDLLEEQKAYYRARAAEYDEWFLRQGRYDRGEECNQRWFGETNDLKAALAAFRPEGDVLELAAGTGWWTSQLLEFAEQLTAVDASQEALALNRRRIDWDDRVTFVHADVFEWQPAHAYDVVFFSFWLSHVPLELFDAFWERVGLALKPEGRVFYIDSLRTESSTAADHALPGTEDAMSRRKLNDGKEYRVVKIFHTPKGLEARLEKLGWQAAVQQTPNYFLYGSARRA